MKIINWLLCQIDWIKFRFYHPSVPVIKPLTVGTYYSQDGQDMYLSALFFNILKQQSGQYVVDIGCNHPEHFSNSKFFEEYYNCKTIAIDPIEEYGELWKEYRPAALFIPTALGASTGTVILTVPEKSASYDDMFSSILGKNPKIGDTPCLQREVPCVTLSSILDTQSIASVAILSLDVEGAEISVLEGIDFERAKIKCFLVENNSKSLFGTEEIRVFLQSKGYVFFSRIGFYDDVFVHSTIVDSLPQHRRWSSRVASLFGL